MAHPALRIGVIELRRRPGTRRPLQVSTPLPDLAVTTARVPDGAEVSLEGDLEAVEGGITLSATVRAAWAGECRRCLETVEGSVEVEVREVFETDPTEGDTYPIEGDFVDLEPVVRDAVLLHLPLAPLCRDDCRGPAPEAFPTALAGEEPGDEDGPPRDPRWAALDDLDLD